MKIFTPRRLGIGLVVLLVLGVAGYWFTRPAPNDTRYNGAYRFEDGDLAFVTAREGPRLRIRWMDGESHVLWPDGGGYVVGADFSGREPARGRVTFRGEAGGTLVLERADGEVLRAERLELPEETFTFRSGDLRLRGRLVRPPGPGPFPAVVIVHGSGDESAVETYFYPYLFAAHGIATLAYDKRGTGASEGAFTQNFHVLADDVLAAVGWLRGRPAVDTASIHLAGYSQGGWIAPLAAARDGGIRSLLIGYGPMVPVTGEDRWGYVYALERQGFGADAIAAADSINGVIEAILDRGEDRWAELDARMAAVKGEPWLEAVKGSDSMLGFVADTWMPTWFMKLYYRWMRRGDVPFIDRTYDPVPVVASLDAPSLWIFGGEDHSMPTGWTLDRLDSLRAEGAPVHTRLYPDADHGILRFEEDEVGARRALGYEAGYLQAMVDWLAR